VVDCQAFVVHNFFGACNRATVNNDSFIGRFSHAGQFFDPPANTGKAGATAISFACQLARGRIRELADIRSDSGAGVDNPCFSFGSTIAR